MKKLNQENMVNVVGGASLSAAFITGLLRIANAIYEMGQSYGSNIRRINENKMCKL